MNVSPEQQQRVAGLPHFDPEAFLMVESMPGLAWAARRDGTLEYLNRRFQEYAGTRIDLGWADVLHPDDVAHTIESWSRAVDAGSPYEADHRVRRFDGAFRWFRASARPMRNYEGQVVRWYGVSIDIDDRKRADEAEQSISHLIDTLPAMVWRTTAAGEADYVNSRWKSYTGGSLAHVADPVWQGTYFHPDDADRLAREFRRARETETTFDVTGRVRRADGSYRWFHTRAEPMRDEAGRVVHWYGVDVDIDDWKKAEEERERAEDVLRATQAKLSRASEMATVSQMAASIAHEISQPLAALVANGHAAQRWLSAEPPNLDRALLTVERIVRDGNAAADVVRRIRALFQRTDSARTVLDLNEVIAEVRRLMADDFSARGVTLDIDLARDLPSVVADRVQMQQVIVNLARNGVDAMESDESRPKTLAIRSRRDGPDNLLIEVQDHGKGLGDVEQVFEPFVTTKEQGMGMGLAISRWIVEAHDGRLWAASNASRGATFSFTIPIGSRDS